MNTSNLDAFMAAEAKRYQKRLKQIVSKDKQSGKMRKSIKVHVNGTKLELEALDYFEFQDKGVNGKKNKHGSIYSYKKKKPPAKAFLSYTGGDLSHAFAISNSIYMNGLRPKNYLIDANKNLNNKGILDAYNKDISNELQRQINLT